MPGFRSRRIRTLSTLTRTRDRSAPLPAHRPRRIMLGPAQPTGQRVAGVRRRLRASCHNRRSIGGQLLLAAISLHPSLLDNTGASLKCCFRAIFALSGSDIGHLRIQSGAHSNKAGASHSRRAAAGRRLVTHGNTGRDACAAAAAAALAAAAHRGRRPRRCWICGKVWRTVAVYSLLCYWSRTGLRLRDTRQHVAPPSSFVLAMHSAALAAGHRTAVLTQ